MRIVVVSSGATAPPFVAELSREHDVAIVHDGDEARDELKNLDAEIIFGTGTDPASLRRAGTKHASHFIAWTSSDEINIIACLTARQIGSAHTVCCVEKEEYVRTFGGANGGGAGAPDLGIDTLIWPAWRLAPVHMRLL